MRWAVETLGEAVDAELEALPPSLRARMLRLMEMADEEVEGERIGYLNPCEGKCERGAADDKAR
jgi:hypothetical protein